MKKLTSIVLTLCILFAIPISANAKTNEKIYKKGDHTFVYVVQKDNTVKITGYYYYGEKEVIKLKIPSKIKGKTVTVIGKSVFGRDSYIKLLDEYGNGAGIEEFELPSNLISIEEAAFSYNYCLEKIDLPQSLKHIGHEAFIYCENLREIKIGDNIESVSDHILYATEFYANEKNWDGKKWDSALYLGNCLLQIPSGAEKYTIKSGTRVIADEALEPSDIFNYKLSELTFPKSVKYIGKRASGEANYLKSFIIRGYRGTAAEKFAKEKGATFKALNPAAPKITVKAGKKKLKVSWKSVKTAEGYQIKYGSKTAETKKLKKTIKLKKGTYKVKVRCYKIKDGKRVYSPWSKAKRITIK